MSNKAIKEVMDMIEKKSQEIKAMRKNSSRDQDPVQEILKCLNKLDAICTEKDGQIDKMVNIEVQCKMLDSRLKNYDPYVRAVVEWTDEKDWRKMQPTGITVYWSKFYTNLYPNAKPEEFIDVGRLLLDDYE